MSKKEATEKKNTEEEEHYPIYVQSSNPSDRLLSWIAKMSKKSIVYFQSGTPGDPPPCPPGGC